MKRIITLLTVFALLFNLSVPFASAEEVSPASDDISFELIEALGIDEGINPDGSAAVTRAEFAAMAVRAVNMDEFSGYDGSFTDVADSHPFVNEIYTAKNLKLTNGTAPGVFSPDDTVDRNVALKMILIAMGYETMAITYGGYPLGYNILEAQLGIFNGITSSDTLTVNDAKLIITTALKEDAAVFSAIENGNFVYSTNKGVNLLTERFNLKKVSGTVTKAGYISPNLDFANDDYITISGTGYQCLVPAVSYFGLSVDAWVGADDNKVYAIEDTGSSKLVTINAEDIVSCSGNKLTVYQGSKSKTYNIPKGISFIENGRLISHSDSDFVFPEGTLKLIDSEGNGSYDYAIAEKTEYFVISGVNAVNEIIYDKNSALGFIELEADSEYVRIIEDKDGNVLSFADLKADMVVEAICSADGKVSIVRVSDSKKLDGIAQEIGVDSVVIDGTGYKTNSYFENTGIRLIPGEAYTFYIASDSTLTLAKRSGSGGTQYGYYLGFDRNGGLDPKASIKILTSSNLVEVFELADKLTLDGDRINKTDSKIDETLITGGIYNYQVIRYTVDSEGKVTMIDTVDPTLNESWERVENPDPDNMLTKYLDGGSVNYRGGSYFGAPSFSFTRGTIFVAPTELRSGSETSYPDEAFEVMDYSSLQNNVNYTVDAYDFNEYYYPQAIVVYQDTTGGTVSTQSASHFVYSVTDALNQDGEVTKLIRSYSKGRYYSYYVAAEELNSITLPKPGDCVRYALDHNNSITKVSVDASYDATQKLVNILYAGEYNGIISYISGNVKNIGDNSLVLRANSAPTTLQNTSNIAPLPLSSASYAIYDVTRGTVDKCSINDILTEELVGESASSYVLCRLNYYAVTDVIIYKQ